MALTTGILPRPRPRQPLVSAKGLELFYFLSKERIVSILVTLFLFCGSFFILLRGVFEEVRVTPASTCHSDRVSDALLKDRNYLETTCSARAYLLGLNRTQRKKVMAYVYYDEDGGTNSTMAASRKYFEGVQLNAQINQVVIVKVLQHLPRATRNLSFYWRTFFRSGKCGFTTMSRTQTSWRNSLTI